jgi:hypothetical protein
LEQNGEKLLNIEEEYIEENDKSKLRFKNEHNDVKLEKFDMNISE